MALSLWDGRGVKKRKASLAKSVYATLYLFQLSFVFVILIFVIYPWLLDRRVMIVWGSLITSMRDCQTFSVYQNTEYSASSSISQCVLEVVLFENLIQRAEHSLCFSWLIKSKCFKNLPEINNNSSMNIICHVFSIG